MEKQKKSDLTLPAEPEVSVYRNEHNAVTIDQGPLSEYDERQIVYLSPLRARVVAAELIKLADEIERS